jgi:dTDP-4-dehydrorhamnose reductase
VALREVFPDAEALTRQDWDVTVPANRQASLILHAAGWTDVDAAESERDGTARVNVGGTENVVALGAPVLYFSTDYVFNGEKREPYVESDEPRPLSVYGQTKLDGERVIGDGWVVRTSWLFGWTGRNFVRTMLRLGGEHDEVRVVADQRGSPTYTGHLAAAVPRILELPYGIRHVAAQGDCTWTEFAQAIFEEAGVDCRVVPITTGELGRPARRPAYSVLRSEHGDTPQLPHWREGLRACLARL